MMTHSYNRIWQSLPEAYSSVVLLCFAHYRFLISWLFILFILLEQKPLYACKSNVRVSYLLTQEERAGVHLLCYVDFSVVV